MSGAEVAPSYVVRDWLPWPEWVRPFLQADCLVVLRVLKMFETLMSVAGPLIGAASSLFGGKKDRSSAEEQQLQNYLNQKEFAQHGIRWRVEDAKAAGLHPLYAIQGGGATFSPNPIVTNFGETFGNMGQNLSRAAQAAMSSPEKRSQELQEKLIQQQIAESASRESLNFAQMEAVNSKRVLDEQAQWTEFPGPGPFTHMESQGTTGKAALPPNVPIPGQFEFKRHEITSGDASSGNKLAGPPEGRYREGQVGSDPRAVLLFPQQGGQFQEDMTFVDVPAWVAANVDRYGWNAFLGRWMTAKERLVETRKWDRGLVDAIQRFIDRKSNLRR